MFCKYCGKPVEGGTCASCGKAPVLHGHSEDLRRWMDGKPMPISPKPPEIKPEAKPEAKTMPKPEPKSDPKALEEAYQRGLREGRDEEKRAVARQKSKLAASWKKQLRLAMAVACLLCLVTGVMAYSVGFDNGKAAGYDAGKAAGYDEGKVAGYDEGKVAGYDEGKVAGYDEGKAAGDKAGYDRGYAAGEHDAKQVTPGPTDTPTRTPTPMPTSIPMPTSTPMPVSDVLTNQKELPDQHTAEPIPDDSGAAEI